LFGHEIVGVDIDPAKVEAVNEGRCPHYEPGVSRLLTEHRDDGVMRATVDVAEAVAVTDMCFICVSTPSKPSGAIDDTSLRQVMRALAEARRRTGRPRVIVVRSTALPDRHAQMMALLRPGLGDGQPLGYAVHPEFLRAGEAVDDFLNPSRIIFGCTDELASEACAKIYPGIRLRPTFTDPVTAALAKYADNGFHAVKITFANEIGLLARGFGGDARAVMDLLCMDAKLNISDAYLKPGQSFGGSCLPKDLRAALDWGHGNAVALPMLEQVLPSNTHQLSLLIERILDSGSRAVGLFGMAFKAGTDDVRESPLRRIAEALREKDIAVAYYEPAFDPAAAGNDNGRATIGPPPGTPGRLTRNAHDLVRDSAAIVISRPFPEIDWRDLPWRPG
jgi:GDP-mannose 6-dehydrogenase